MEACRFSKACVILSYFQNLTFCAIVIPHAMVKVKYVKIWPEKCKLSSHLTFNCSASWWWQLVLFVCLVFPQRDWLWLLSCIKKHALVRVIRANAVLKSERQRCWRSFCIEISGRKCSPVKIISMMSKSDLYSWKHNCFVMAHYLTFYKASFNTANEYFCAHMLTAGVLLWNKWHQGMKQNIKYTVCLLLIKELY